MYNQAIYKINKLTTGVFQKTHEGAHHKTNMTHCTLNSLRQKGVLWTFVTKSVITYVGMATPTEKFKMNF